MGRLSTTECTYLPTSVFQTLAHPLLLESSPSLGCALHTHTCDSQRE